MFWPNFHPDMSQKQDMCVTTKINCYVLLQWLLKMLESSVKKYTHMGVKSKYEYMEICNKRTKF